MGAPAEPAPATATPLAAEDTADLPLGLPAVLGAGYILNLLRLRLFGRVLFLF